MSEDCVWLTTRTLFGFGGGFDWRRTSFLEPLSPERVCSYCALVGKWTALLPCSHTACTRCFSKFVRRGCTCVLDRTCFAGRQVCWYGFFEEDLARLSIRCWNAASGCDVIGPAFRTVQHFQRECEYHALNCNFCGKTVLLREVDEHLESSCLQAFSLNRTLATNHVMHTQHETRSDAMRASCDSSHSAGENGPLTKPSSYENDTGQPVENGMPISRALTERFRKENIVPVVYECNEATSSAVHNSVRGIVVGDKESAARSGRAGEIDRESHSEDTAPCPRTKCASAKGNRKEVKQLEQRGLSVSTNRQENLHVDACDRTDSAMYASGEALGHYLRFLWESIPTVKGRHIEHVYEPGQTPPRWCTDVRREHTDVIITPTSSLRTNGVPSRQVRPTSPVDEPDEDAEEKRGNLGIKETSSTRVSNETAIDCNGSLPPLPRLLHQDVGREPRDVIITPTSSLLRNGAPSRQVRPTSPGDDPVEDAEEKRGNRGVKEASTAGKMSDETAIDCNGSLPLCLRLLQQDLRHCNRQINGEILKQFIDDVNEDVASVPTPIFKAFSKLQTTKREHTNGWDPQCQETGEISPRAICNRTKRIEDAQDGTASWERVTGNSSVYVIDSGLQAVQKYSKSVRWSVENWSALKATALADGAAYSRCSSDTCPFYGYKISPALLIENSGGLLLVRLAFFVLKGEYDDFLMWPIKKKMVLTFLHPSDKSRRLKLNVNTTIDGTSEDYMPPKDKETGPILSPASIIVTHLETKGHIIDDKVVLKFRVMELSSRKRQDLSDEGSA